MAVKKKKSKYIRMQALREILYNKNKDAIKIIDTHMKKQFSALIVFSILLVAYSLFAGFTARYSVYAPLIFLVLLVYLLYKFKKVIVRHVIIGEGYKEREEKKK